MVTPPASSAPDPAVVGLDLSLTSTGIALADGTPTRVTPGKARGGDRIEMIAAAVLRATTPKPDLIAIEGYAFGALGRAILNLAELGGVVRFSLHLRKCRVVDIAPATLKKYATGVGTANKVAVLIAARDRLGYTGQNDDEADALWLRAIGRALLGDPVVTVPKTHQAALKGVGFDAR